MISGSNRCDSDDEVSRDEREDDSREGCCTWLPHLAKSCRVSAEGKPWRGWDKLHVQIAGHIRDLEPNSAMAQFSDARYAEIRC